MPRLWTFSLTLLLLGNALAGFAQAQGTLTIDELIDIKHPSSPTYSPDVLRVISATSDSQPKRLSESLPVAINRSRLVAPDYHGSIGYGRAWRLGIFLDVGGKDSKDATEAATYLKSLDYVDAQRIGVWGLSYGGFFTLLSLVNAPTTFACGVDVAGVVDYRMYWDDPYHGSWTYGRLGAPEDNPEAHDVASPLSRMERLEKPLLVLHGTADINVFYLHSVRLIDDLLARKRSFEFKAYPGEFHYFTRERVLSDAWRRVERFFHQHLK